MAVRSSGARRSRSARCLRRGRSPMSRCLASAAVPVGLQRGGVSQHGGGPPCDGALQLVDRRHDGGLAGLFDPAVE